MGCVVAPIVDVKGLGIGGTGRASPSTVFFPAFVSAISVGMETSAAEGADRALALVAFGAAFWSSLPLRFAPRCRLRVEMETASPSAASDVYKRQLVREVLFLSDLGDLVAHGAQQRGDTWGAFPFRGGLQLSLIHISEPTRPY